MMLSKWRLNESRLLSEGRRGPPMEIGDLRPSQESEVTSDLWEAEETLQPQLQDVREATTALIDTNPSDPESLNRHDDVFIINEVVISYITFLTLLILNSIKGPN